ncbi:MAG: hypothetical protein KTR32_10230 [Granulosicoccus sp.]|nr:hypothetical protein [Granulosicoccus sp.]
MRPDNDNASGYDGGAGNADQTSEAVRPPEIDSVAKLLTSIVETACEHEPDLDLMRFVNYVDLYRTYLADFNAREKGKRSGTAGTSSSAKPVGFEYFVRDSHLLKSAAACSAIESREDVAVPLPLGLGANQSSLH